MPTALRIGSAHDLRSCLEGALDKAKDRKEIDEDLKDFKSKIKTYLIESNNPSTSDLVQDKIIIRNTLDINLKVLKATSRYGKDYELYLDTTDKRFWKIYSLNKSEISDRIINMLVLRNKNRLDFAWFPSSLLEKYMSLGKETGFSLKYKNKFIKEGTKKINVSMRFWGDGGKEILASLRSDNPISRGTALSSISLDYHVEDGFAKENISSSGKFTVMSGDSVDSHFVLLENIKKDYSKIINLIESDYRMGAYGTEIGIKLKNNALYVEFPKEIEDLDAFVDMVFSAKHPFRLLGTIDKVSHDFFRVYAVDLHSNGLVDFEITPNLMAIHLNIGSCGNVIMRLVTNMQRYMDHKVKLVDDNDTNILKSY